MGLAIYNSIILDVRFPTVVYKKLLFKKPTLGDLRAQNPEMAKGFETLLAFSPPEDVEKTYCRTFTVEYVLVFLLVSDHVTQHSRRLSGLIADRTRSLAAPSPSRSSSRRAAPPSRSRTRTAKVRL